MRTKDLTFNPDQKKAHSAMTATVATNVTVRPVDSSIGLVSDISIRLKKPRSRRSITSIRGGSR